MSLVFLHSADWQLGKPFASVRDEAKRHRLQQERLHAVRRLAELATISAADFILIAGDILDSHATKEHNAATVCLTMAEILDTDHDDTVTILLDDACIDTTFALVTAEFRPPTSAEQRINCHLLKKSDAIPTYLTSVASFP